MAKIKRNKDRIDKKDLQEKVLALPSEFSSYQIRMEGFSLEEMQFEKMSPLTNTFP